MGAQAWPHLRGREEGRAPPSVWEKYWNKERLLDKTGHSQSRAEGQGQRNGKLEPGEKGGTTMSPSSTPGLLQRLYPGPCRPVIISVPGNPQDGPPPHDDEEDPW